MVIYLLTKLPFALIIAEIEQTDRGVAQSSRLFIILWGLPRLLLVLFTHFFSVVVGYTNKKTTVIIEKNKERYALDCC